jgi:Mlc titration factor MtfA (ptsG expression regulator)
VLAGTVAGNYISLSWKHLLADLQQANDGVNVGLHEMAHALHRQHEHFYGIRGKAFRSRFEQIDSLDDTIMNREKQQQSGLYPPYAHTSPHELWACSVELFFERSAALNNQYPELYAALCHVLNQDPLRGIWRA